MTDAAWASVAAMTAAVAMAAVAALLCSFLAKSQARQEQHLTETMKLFLSRNFTEFVGGQMMGKEIEIEQDEDTGENRARVADYIRDMERELEQAEVMRRS